MFEIQFQESHLLLAAGAEQGVIAEGKEDHFTPSVKATEDGVF